MLINLDWEYPSANDRSGRKEDFANFPKMIANLKKALKGSGGRDGLTITLPASYCTYRGIGEDGKCLTDALLQGISNTSTSSSLRNMSTGSICKTVKSLSGAPSGTEVSSGFVRVQVQNGEIAKGQSFPSDGH